MVSLYIDVMSQLKRDTSWYSQNDSLFDVFL